MMTATTVTTAPDLTLDDVCEVMSASRSTVVGLIRSGQLRAYRLGKSSKSHWRVRQADLEQFIEESLRESNEE